MMRPMKRDARAKSSSPAPDRCCTSSRPRSRRSKARIGEAFVAACRLIDNCTGRVVVTGMGKSGHIGDKIAATFASTGTPAFFLHAAEASHGDIGMITPADVVLALSNSGETAELIAILPVIKRLGVGLIALTGKAQSTLARAADVVLDISVPQEACPLNLAPTASTTATLAMGDALAVALLDARGFTEEDFARSHPGGSLGRKLLLHVEDVMRTGEQLPRVTVDTSLHDGLIEMSAKGLGMTTIVDAAGSCARRIHRWRPAPAARQAVRSAQLEDGRSDETQPEERAAPECSRPRPSTSWRPVVSLPCRSSMTIRRTGGRAQRS